MSHPLLTAALVLAALIYLTIGLFTSRAYWWSVRPYSSRDDAVVFNAVGIIVAWPLFAVGYGVMRFAQWFYRLK